MGFSVWDFQVGFRALGIGLGFGVWKLELCQDCFCSGLATLAPRPYHSKRALLRKGRRDWILRLVWKQKCVEDISLPNPKW